MLRGEAAGGRCAEAGEAEQVEDIDKGMLPAYYARALGQRAAAG